MSSTKVYQQKQNYGSRTIVYISNEKKHCLRAFTRISKTKRRKTFVAQHLFRIFVQGISLQRYRVPMETDVGCNILPEGKTRIRKTRSHPPDSRKEGKNSNTVSVLFKATIPVFEQAKTARSHI